MKQYRGKHSEKTEFVREKPSVDGGGKKPRRRSRLSRKQKWLVAVCVVLALTLVFVAVYKSLFVKPELPAVSDPAAPEKAEELDYGDGIQPRVSGERKSKDYYTVLILGRDTGGGGNTDTMLLASYDVTNQKATVMSIPRDTMVNVSWDIKRINSVYNYYGGGDKGIQHLYGEIAQLVGFAPDYQVVVEWEAVGKIVDAVGGVWFDVPRNMNYEDPYQDLSIHQTKGYRLLTGDDAMQVIRYRHDNNGKSGYPDGDLGRIKVQQAFLKAMIEQVLKLKNVSNVNKLAKVFDECVETDLSLQNLLWFGQAAYLGGLRVDNVEFVTMPNTPKSCYSRSVGNMQSYVTPNARELLELVNTSLSPFVEKFTLSDLDIMSVNADGSVSSTTGHVEDSRAAVPPETPGRTEEPSEEPVEGDPGEGGTTQTPGEGGTAQTPGEGGTAQTPGEGETTQTPGEGETGGTPQEPPSGGGESDPGEGLGTDLSEPAAPAETAIGEGAA